MSEKNKGRPIFDHMPPELSKAIAERARQQASTPPPTESAATQKSGGGEKTKK